MAHYKQGSGLQHTERGKDRYVHELDMWASRVTSLEQLKEYAVPGRIGVGRMGDTWACGHSTNTAQLWEGWHVPWDSCSQLKAIVGNYPWEPRSVNSAKILQWTLMPGVRSLASDSEQGI